MPHSIELDAILAPEGNEDAYYVERMRQWRDGLLAQSDWTQMPDSPLTDAKKQEWQDYRQSLRDFPATWTPQATAQFPDEPT